MTSTPASTMACTRSSVPGPTPTAAPTRRLWVSSLHALGNFRDLVISLAVIRPRREKSPFTTRTFSMRCLCSNAVISSLLAPSLTVTSLSLDVIIFLTGSSNCVSNRKSRLVTIPTNSSPSTTGTPEISLESVRLITSLILVMGLTVIGSRITPASYFLTCRTCLDWSSGLIFLCITPIPPSCAMAIAVLLSVTVSIAAVIRGILSFISRVRWVTRFTSRGSTFEYEGTSKTSSKVRA